MNLFIYLGSLLLLLFFRNFFFHFSSQLWLLITEIWHFHIVFCVVATVVVVVCYSWPISSTWIQQHPHTQTHSSVKKKSRGFLLLLLLHFDLVYFFISESKKTEKIRIQRLSCLVFFFWRYHILISYWIEIEKKTTKTNQVECPLIIIICNKFEFWEKKTNKKKFSIFPFVFFFFSNSLENGHNHDMMNMVL